MNLKLTNDHSATLATDSKPFRFPVWVWRACILPVVENRLFGHISFWYILLWNISKSVFIFTCLYFGD